MRVINGFRMLDSIREVSAYDYFQFQKNYTVLVNTESALLGEVADVFRKASPMIGEGRGDDAVNLLQNAYISVWKDAKSYSDIFKAASHLIATTQDKLAALEDLTSRHIGYAQLLSELKLVVSAFEQEVEACFPDLAAGPAVADYRRIREALLRTDTESPERSLAGLFEEIASVTSNHRVERFDPSDSKAFQNRFDVRMAEWYQALGLKEQDVRGMSYFDFLSRAGRFGKKTG